MSANSTTRSNTRSGSPSQSPTLHSASPMGFEPTISAVTGQRALRTAPRGQVRSAHRGVVLSPGAPHSLHAGVRRRFSSAATGLDRELIPDGLEPSLPGCKPGVVAAEPRDRRQSNSLKWTHRESHPDPRHARPASSSWTMSPRVIPRRISHGTGNLSDSGSRGTRTHNGVSSVPAFEAGS